MAVLTAPLAPGIRAPGAQPAAHASSAGFVEPCKRAVEFSLAHFLYDQAVFFAERLVAELPTSDEALRLLAGAHFQGGDAARACVLLQERQSAEPQLRYLLALCCLRLDKPEEAERALLTRPGGSVGSRARPSHDFLTEVPCGGPGLFLLGQARERLQRREQAIECYSKCLELCPFMWCAYERLSRLSLGVHGARGTARAFAGSRFDEDRFLRDPVLCPPSAPSDGVATDGSVAEAGCAAAGPAGRAARALPTHTGNGEAAPATAPKKRRRSTSLSPLKASVAPATPSAASPLRTPLADRSVAVPMQLPAQPRLQLRTPVPAPQALPLEALGTAAAAWRAPEAVALDTGTAPGFAAIGLQAPAPSLAGLLRLLGEALHSVHAFACPQALEVLKQLPAREHGTALVQDLVARCHFEMAEYARAAEVYAGCCEMHKLYKPLGLEYYSTALWHMREAMQLCQLAQRVLQWDRLRPQVWCVVGNCLSLQREHEQAIRAFRRALQVDPSFAYAYTLIAHEYAAIEKFDKAIQMYEQAISVDCRHYNAWWGLGNVYYKQEEYQNARYHFQKAVTINSGNAVLRTSLGMALQSVGEPECALRLFTSAAQSQHCSALVAFQKGCVLASLGRQEEAVEELQHAQGLAPREPCVHFQLGRAHADLGDSRRALLHFTMAMDLSGAKDSKDHQVIASAQAELLRVAGPQQHSADSGLAQRAAPLLRGP